MVLSACAGCDRASESPTGGDALDGRTFVLESAEGCAVPPGATVRLTFEGAELRAYGGCNSMGAPYDAEGARLVVDEQQMWTTERGCEPPLHEHDGWLASFLGADPALTLADGRLTLEGGDVTLVLLDRELAEPDQPLVGTAWELSTIVVGDVAGFGEWPTTVLRWGDDGTFAIAAGCPVVSGTYSMSGDVLKLVGAQPDVSGCPAEPADWVTAAAGVLSDGASTFAIASARLSLTRGDVTLEFQAQP
jgi:heat shock protein HslJ